MNDLEAGLVLAKLTELVPWQDQTRKQICWYSQNWRFPNEKCVGPLTVYSKHSNYIIFCALHAARDSSLMEESRWLPL